VDRGESRGIVRMGQAARIGRAAAAHDVRRSLRECTALERSSSKSSCRHSRKPIASNPLASTERGLRTGTSCDSRKTYAMAQGSARLYITDLCRITGSANAQLEYAFKEVIGLAPMAYLARLRLPPSSAGAARPRPTDRPPSPPQLSNGDSGISANFPGRIRSASASCRRKPCVGGISPRQRGPT